MTIQDPNAYMIEYKEYICHFVFDEKDNFFHGRVANSHYLMEFKGRSIRELTEAGHLYQTFF